MPLHGRLPARISPVTNGWWPHGHGGPAANAPARGFQIPISNSPDPNRRVHGAAVGGDRNAPLVFVVHGVRARKFPPCPGPLHRRLARSLLEYGRQPRRPGRPSSPPPATSPGRRVAISSTFLQRRTRASTWYRPSFCPDYRALGRRRRGGGENLSPPGRVADMDFAGPSVPARIGPAAPGVSMRAAGEFAVWVAKSGRPRKLERRGPAAVAGNDDSGPLVL